MVSGTQPRFGVRPPDPFRGQTPGGLWVDLHIAELGWERHPRVRVVRSDGVSPAQSQREDAVSAAEPAEAPQLTPEGAELLRDVLARHNPNTRWTNANEPPPVDLEEQIESDASAPQLGRSASLAIVAVVVVGGLIGLSSTLFNSPGITQREPGPWSSAAAVEAEVAGVSLDPEAGELSANSEVAAAGVGSEADDLGEASDPATSDRIAPPTDVTNSPPADEAPEAGPAPNDMTLTVYSSALQDTGVAAFAVRVSQDSGSTVSTSAFAAQVEQDGKTIPADIRFEQNDLPADGGSAVAVVRAPVAIDGSAEVILLWLGTEVARAAVVDSAN